MKAVTAGEIQSIDRTAIEERGMPGEVLMAMAGKAVFDHIMSLKRVTQKAAVFAGTGNNGGDGFVIAYFLRNSGIVVDCYLTGSADKLSQTSKIYYNLCEKSGIPLIELNDEILEDMDFMEYDLFIDAMIGTGFNGELRGMVKKLVSLINNISSTYSTTMVIAVDMPSGLPSDGQGPRGDVIRAEYTVTMGLPKLSLVTYPGRLYCGEVIIADIGFPKDITESEHLKTEIVNPAMVRSCLGLPRDMDTYKNAEGHVLTIGGFTGMEGAVIMSAMAALQCGVGLVTIMTIASSREIIAGKIPEAMTVGVHATDDEFIQVRALMEETRFQSLVIGPGLGRSKYAESLVHFILENSESLGIHKMLVDGDGLYHLAGYISQGKQIRCRNIIITPHLMEASRIMGVDTAIIKNNRIQSARDCALQCNAVAVLKGPGTITSDGTNIVINSSGNPAMATAGSGDVLSGIIGSLMIKNDTMLMAASGGVYIHGRAGDISCAEQGAPVLQSRDIISCIRTAIGEILNQ